MIAVAAAVADAWNITSDGLETFYAAAVRSMAGNWHDFLYGGFDPSGLISLDKLPGAFWAQALSVRAFGLSTWALVLPQVVWSVLTVIALFLIVRRAAGPLTGLAAAALFALSPVTILTAHGNIGDPLFVLLAVLAAGAVARAAASSRTRHLMLAAVWLGLAFQVKMTEAWLAAAALAAAYLLAVAPGLARSPGIAGGNGRGTWPRELARLAGAGVVLAAVSLSWMVFVTLTPAAGRPYADGSLGNSVFAQVFSYNGASRFGTVPLYGLGYLARPSAAALAYTKQSQESFFSAGSQTPPAWDRLLSAPLAQVTGWLLLPALLVSVAAVIVALRFRGSGEGGARARAGSGDRDGAGARGRAPVLVWALPLLVFTVVFSAGHEVQSYYFTTLSPAIAALCALGLRAALARTSLARTSLARTSLAGAGGSQDPVARTSSRTRRAAFPAVVTASALASAVIMAEAGSRWFGPALAVGAVALLSGAAAILLTVTACPAVDRPGTPGRPGRLARRGLAVALTVTAAAGLAGPLVADGWDLANRAGAFDSPLAAAGTVAKSNPSVVAGRDRYPGYGGTYLYEASPSVWGQLRNTGQIVSKSVLPGQWFAVYTSAAAATYLLGGTQRVLPIGGFTGSVPFPSTGYLTSLLAAKRIAFAVVPGPGDPRFTDPRVQAIVRHCTQTSGVGDETARARVYYCQSPR